MSEQHPIDPHSNSARERPSRLGPTQVFFSTIAAAFGVQSSRNRARDFQTGKPSHFIVAGIVFTILFVVGMIALVRFVLAVAAG